MIYFLILFPSWQFRPTSKHLNPNHGNNYVDNLHFFSASPSFRIQA